MSGTLVYLQVEDELLLLDASDPTAPVPVGRARSLQRWTGVWAEEALAYAANGTLGLEILDFSSCVPARTRFQRGDCTGDGKVDISDATCIVDWLFLGGPTPACIAVTNVNGDRDANFSDATYLLHHLFLGGAAPVSPFPDCGPGTLPTDAETCERTPVHCRQ